MTPVTQTHEQVQEYYGRVLRSSRDLKTDACCPTDALPHRLRTLVGELEPEVVERHYGCGSPIPPGLDGCTVLDLGCGAGRDVYLCSRLVGEEGRVIGVDMTEEQLQVARRHQETMAARYGYPHSNVSFRQGFMEDLAALGIEDGSVDVVISNCVINLAPDKEPVFREILRVLKPGGELYVADVFADRRLPLAWLQDDVLVGECLAGAMYTEDFRRMMRRLGVLDTRVVRSRQLGIDHPDIAAQVGETRFFARTIRLFKLASLEDRCEDYGQVATYKGTLAEAPNAFTLDDHHLFEAHRPERVCGNTAAMLQDTRYGRHFQVTGTRQRHFGLFPCGPATRSAGESEAPCC